MSIASEITRLQNAKAALKTQIEAKGVTVDTAATLDAYATYVEEIPTGGGDENRLNMLLTNTLTAVTASDLSGVTAITDYTFNGKSSLKSIILPDTITRIGKSAFLGCSGITSFNPNKVETFGERAFYGCSGLTEVNCEHLVDLGNDQGIESFAYCSSLTGFTFPNTFTGATIGRDMFRNCNLQGNFTIPKTIRDLQYGALQQNTGITSVTFDTTYLNNIGNGYGASVFGGDSNIEYFDFTKQVIVPGLQNANTFTATTNYEIRVPQTLYGQWTAATNWKNENIVSHITSYPDVWTTGNIYYTTSNGSAITPNIAYNRWEWNAGKLSEEYDATTGGTVTMYGPLEIPVQAYYNRTALTSISFPEGTKGLRRQMCSGCSNLSAITIPNSVEEIESNTFSSLPAITTLEIPDNITKLYGTTFNGLVNLTKVTIGSGITSVGEYVNYSSDVFYQCRNLSELTIKAPVPPTVVSRGGVSEFANGVANSGILYVPAGSVSAYQDWVASIGSTKLTNWTITAITE